MQNQSISRKRFIRRMGAALATGFAFLGLASLARGSARSSSLSTSGLDTRCTRDPRARAYRDPHV